MPYWFSWLSEFLRIRLGIQRTLKIKPLPIPPEFDYSEFQKQYIDEICRACGIDFQAIHKESDHGESL